MADANLDKWSSTDIHADILSYMRPGRDYQSVDIHVHLMADYEGLTTNTMSWALVELQNAARKRGHQAGDGPITRVRRGVYRKH